MNVGKSLQMMKTVELSSENKFGTNGESCHSTRLATDKQPPHTENQSRLIIVSFHTVKERIIQGSSGSVI